MELSLAEFDELTPIEFNLKLKGWQQKNERQLDNDLWQTRFLAMQVINYSQRIKEPLRDARRLFRLPGEQKLQNEKSQQRDLKKLAQVGKDILNRHNKKKNG